MARVKTYRGLTEEELKDMDIQTFMQYVTARERRTLKRLNQFPMYKKLINKVRKLKAKGKINKPIKTRVRSAVIIPEWLGLKFAVHNGKEYVPVEITIDKLGFRLGDFSHTTAKVVHSGPGVGATRSSKFVPLK
ncbi:ribosomal protein S19 family protein [Candidatus Micrarchaeota archaeon]|nr:ribosomal protein S19 family protein [Candidatus Micrarchaeota archaeon]